MSNSELIRRSTTALNHGELDGFLEGWAADAVLDWSRSSGLQARVYQGKAEIREFARRFRDAFADVEIEILDDPVEVEAGLLVVDNLVHVRGRDGIAAQARSAWLITIRDGHQTSLTLYRSKEDALAAARATS
jgi:ketosteroid isomerase-like protein